MAKQKKEKQIPFKQQVYEQMLTSQLYGDQSPTSQANLDKIQKSYNEWQSNKETTARIQERYNAWLEERKKSQQPSEPSEATSPPKATQKSVEATTAPKATKKAAEPKEKKKYLTHSDVMQGLNKRSVDVTNYPEMANLEQGGTVDLFNRPKVNTSELKKAGWKDAGDGEATVFSSTYTNTKGDKAGNFTPIVTDAKGNYLRTLSDAELTKYAEAVLDGRKKDTLKLQIGKTHGGKKAIDNAVSAAKRVHELQEDYYMNPRKSKADEAFKKKDVVGGSVKQLDLSKYNLPNTGITEEDFALEKTKIKGKNQKKGTVPNKSVAESAARGAAKTPFRVSKFLADASADVYQSLAEPTAQIVDELTGSGFDNRARVREKADALRARLDKNYADLRREEEIAEAQHPGAFGAGNAATQLAMYYVTNPVFDSIGKGLGVTSEAGRFALNQLGQNAQDVVLDIIPTLAEMMEDGKITKEEGNELARQGAFDAFTNLAIPGAQYGLGKSEQALYEALGKTVGNNADVLKSMDATGAVRNIKNATKQIPKFDAPKAATPEEIARLNINPLEADNRQFSEFMNNYNNQFKDDSAMRNIFTPEDVEASQNNQLAELMDEYRARSAVNDLAGNVAEPVSKNAIPELRGPAEAIGETTNAINPTPSTLKLSDEVWDKLDSRFTEIAELTNKVQRSKIMDTVTDEKALKEWAAVNEAYSNYLNKAMFDGTIEETEAAKKVLDNARKRYSRAMKDINPEIAKEFKSGTYGKQIGRPVYDRNVKNFEDSSQETTDLINTLENTESAAKNFPNTTKPAAKTQQITIENEKEFRKDINSLKASFRAKTRWIKDADNKFAKKFIQSADDFLKKPSTENYEKLIKDHDNYIANAKPNAVMTNWHGTKYKPQYRPEEITSALDNLAKKYDKENFADVKSEKPIYVDATGKRPYAKNQGVSPSIENEAKRIDKWIEEQGLEDELSPVEQSIDNAPQDFTVESVNRKGGKKAYYVAANNGDAKVNIQRNKVYKTEAEAQKALKDFKSKTPGADPLQFFANGDTKGEWKIGSWRTNTAEKTGRIKNEEDLPLRNFAFRVFHESEQNEAANLRWGNSKNLAEDLMKVERFDEVDTKAAMHEWQRLMDSGDEKLVRKANWLGVKIDGEVRTAGRTDQALTEFSRNTPEGQVRVAQETIDDIVDKKKGVGTSEALDNIVLKLYNAYIDSNGDKDLFAKKAEEILSGTLRQHVGSKKALKMSNKAIQGKNKVLKMIDKGASVEDIADVIYKQNGGVKLTTKEQSQIYNYLKEAKDFPEGSYEQEELLAKAAKIALARTPSTIGQILRTILYTNMLGNFKTAISRNTFGNLAYQSLEQARQLVAAPVDYATSKVTGKHSALGWNKAKANAYKEGLKKGASATINDVIDIDALKSRREGWEKALFKNITTGRSGQKGWTKALSNNATTFNDTKTIGKFLNGVEYYVRKSMELGDRPFYEAVYNQSSTELNQLLDRYGKDGVAGLEGIKDEEIPAMIDMISSVRAADSVFQRHGKMSKGLTDIRNGLGEMSEGIVGTDILSTAAGAFTLTPGNIIERAIEYSPLGFVKNAVETGREVIGKKGFNQRRFVDEASRSIAGLPILGATYAMAKNGSINGGYSTDPDERAAQQEDGFIEYGYNVPDDFPIYGGRTLDTSDIPVIGPFMQSGSVIAEEGITPKAGLQAAEAVLGGSTTQGFRRAFGSDTPSYSSQNSVIENLVNTVASSGSQLIPSLARQTAQTLDPYKRDLGEYGKPEYYVNLMKNSTPFLRETLPIKTNVEGKKVLQNQGRSMGEKILENYILPMNVSEYKPSPLNVEATRLKKETGENKGFALKAKRSDLRNWDEADHAKYSEEQFRKYKEDLGKLNSNAGNALTKSKFYKDLDDEYKVKYLGDMYTTMKKVARKNATGHVDDDKALNVYLDAGGGKKGTDALIDHYERKYTFGKYDVSESDGSNAIYEKYGEKGIKNYAKVKKSLRGSQKGEDIKSAIDSTLPTLSKSEKATYYSYFKTNVSPGGNPYGYVAGVNYDASEDKSYQKAKAVLPKLSPEKFYETRDKIDKWGDESRGTRYGNGSISEDEMIPYLNANASNLQEAQSIYSAYGNPGTNKKGVTKHVVQKGGKYALSY